MVQTSTLRPAQPAWPPITVEAMEEAPATAVAQGEMGDVGRPELFSPEQVAATIRMCKGTVSQVAKRLKTTHKTIYRYIAQYGICAEAMEEARDERIDAAELSLHKAVLAGEPWAVALTLKTIGKHRGYVERQEQTGPDGGPIQHQAPMIREVIVQMPGSLPPPRTAPPAPEPAYQPAADEDVVDTTFTPHTEHADG